jgi:ATP-dependent DNA helicase RecQ
MDKYEILKRFFGHSGFRPGQEGLIDAILSGRDALGVMPTGGGKSVCYQVPALLLPGVTLVVSPLISLMKDQVAALTSAGIGAGYINSSLSAEQLREVFSRARAGAYKLLYIAPERLETEGFLRLARSLDIPLVAVDEAHCVSQWGQNFRPSYLRISDFIGALPHRPAVAAFTATATQRVQEDIIKKLELRSPLRTVTGFDRPNLFFDVRRPKNRTEELYDILVGREEQSGIVYCTTRNKVELICASLEHRGIAATRYHAGLSDAERRKNQDDFQFDRKTVMVATNAFGMGIDKSNVSFVIHYGMPKSLEAYYQEAGRAGRDGSAADCILLYSPGDVETAKFFIEHNDNPDLTDDELREVKAADYERLNAMRGYCSTAKCLRAYILAYFGQKYETHCTNCGNCRRGYKLEDVTERAQMALSCIERIRRKLGYGVGKQLVIQTLRGSRAQRLLDMGLDGLSTYGLMKAGSDEAVNSLIEALETEGLLETGEHSVLRVTEKAGGVLYRGERLMLSIKREPERKKRKSDTRTESLAPAELEDKGDRKLFEVLRALRMKLAREENVPAYLIFSNAALEDMAEKRPRTKHEFLQVSGVGEAKAEKYAGAFLDRIAEYEGRK